MKGYLYVVLLFALCFVSACKKGDEKRKEVIFDNGPTDSLRLNQIQIIASHNSYHLKTDSAVFAFLVNAFNAGVLPSSYDPNGIDYEHESITDQLGIYGVRGLELDINNDPAGGQFYYRGGPRFVGLNPESFVDELKEPGFKIIHIVDFDYNTTNYTFRSALREVYNWSISHPNHLPIFINVEVKDEAPSDLLPSISELTKTIPYTAASCDELDAEIKSVFGANLDKVITPDDVRGNFATLEEAVLAGNWPKLAECRGKVVFIMQGGLDNLYKIGHPSLQSRAMFVYSSPGTPEAAFVILNNAKSSYQQIQQRVKQGYIVRTRSDASTDEARTGDYSYMNAAFSSWAQIVSTDYYRPDKRAGTPGWTDYTVRFPNGELARIDSISAEGKTDLGTLSE